VRCWQLQGPGPGQGLTHGGLRRNRLRSRPQKPARTLIDDRGGFRSPAGESGREPAGTPEDGKLLLEGHLGHRHSHVPRASRPSKRTRRSATTAVTAT
jgi:hypothetical protein